MAWILFAASICISSPTAFADESERAETAGGTLTGTVYYQSGAPMEGVLVKVNRCEGARVVDIHKLEAITGADGRYEMAIDFTHGDALLLREVWASKDGYIRYDNIGGRRIGRGETASMDFVLSPGEILAGTVEIPAPAGVAASDVKYLLIVRAEGFRQVYVVNADGAFRAFVPAGEYTLEVFNQGIKKTVHSGTRDIRLSQEHKPISPEVLAGAFDALWADMDRNYSYFAYRDGVDWSALKTEYRPSAIAAKNVDEFATIVQQMLSRLNDMHIWIDSPAGRLSSYSNPWNRNWNPNVIMADLTDVENCGSFAMVARTKEDGFGCVVITRQDAATADSVGQAVKAIGKLADAPGFLVDLRGGCNGGDERFARQLAQAFCGKDVVYAKSKFRNGRKHDDFGPVTERVLPAGDEPFLKPVVCLIGHKCMSSGEALVQMFDALPQATTVGATTRGASGNPKPFALPDVDVTVWYSRWVDMMPDGTVVEGRGIEPDVAVDASPTAYGSGDPTWQKAVDLLRERVAAATARND